ncbi:type II toxin-antitoxin system RelE/ParE family toxin [Chthoniobacter flavus]|uniref:type II toxin-antitoxin system RelE/ParE family toxin n=1 Tax=Chthoniobacter flavus TaxID=191863 RepID=UPI0005B2CE17|nr:type II toxin-antitoxin system RelE/ParE family toxin [Chthoniobacter flavus]
MLRILRTPASRSDYEEIWTYIAVHDLAAADRLVDQFDAALRVIALSPRIGRKVDDLSPGLRSFPIGNYLIFYRLSGDALEVIRLVHGARDITPEYFVD